MFTAVAETLALTRTVIAAVTVTAAATVNVSMRCITKFAFLKERVRKSRSRIPKHVFWNPRNPIRDPRNAVLGPNVTPQN